ENYPAGKLSPSTGGDAAELISQALSGDNSWSPWLRHFQTHYPSSSMSHYYNSKFLLLFFVESL
ncbi:hypothetical protein LINPERHAP1_LOCUS37312, partial [Linum perenne]